MIAAKRFDAESFSKRIQDVVWQILHQNLYDFTQMVSNDNKLLQIYLPNILVNI